MGIKIGNIDVSYFKVGSGDCSIYIGDTLLYPTTPPSSSYTEIEYVECRKGGIQLLNNVTTDFYFEVESQFISGSGSPNLVCEKSDTEVVSYQMGLCYYSSNMFLDYGGGRLSTNINYTTQAQKHKYGAGHISGSSYTTLLGVTIDGVTVNNANATVRVEGLPYLVGGLKYTGHTASDVVANNDDMIIYSVKIYTNYGDTLVGDYIPVKDLNNVVTMYDKVSGNFATPYGTLIAGPDKNNI